MRKRKKVKKHKDSITIKAPFLLLPSNKGSKKEPVWLTHDYLPQLIELIKSKDLSLKEIQTLPKGQIKISFHDPRHTTLFGLHYDKNKH